MNDISLKYRLLNKNSQKEVNDFMDFLLSKQKRLKKTIISDYKKRILLVSTWSDKDITEFDKNNKLFNDWKIEEW